MSEIPVKIGLWGATGSGKTAFLGALAVAVDQSGGTADGRAGRSRSRVGSWSIWSKDEGSVAYLHQRKREMTIERQFPEGSTLGAITPLSWGFAGHLAGSEFDKRRWPFRRKELLSSFELDLVDMYGLIFDREPGQAEEAESAVAAAFEHLERAQGLIYLFDPLTERKSHDAIRYVDGTIQELRRRIYKNTGKFGRYLPHELAVCVTKFDHMDLYQQARQKTFVSDGPDGMPIVPDTRAKLLFDAICDGDFWPDKHDDKRERAMLVRQSLCGAFDPKRIRYYVTSAIGFGEKESSAPFDGDRFQENYEGDSKIVGDVRPINVLEPLIHLQQRIAAQRPR